VASTLEGNAEGALVACTGARLAAWLDLGAFAQISLEAIDVFVVNVLYFVHAKGANLSTRYVSLTGSAAGAAGTWATVARTTESGTAACSTAGAIATATTWTIASTAAWRAAALWARLVTALAGGRATLLGCLWSGSFSWGLRYSFVVFVICHLPVTFLFYFVVGPQCSRVSIFLKETTV
jgi:hypothetical protein